jgi:uncharacterized protein YacL
LEAQLLTTDYNLNRVAELQDVPVLNINQLAKALKPVVLPGEKMNITITREGKERDQGVAYLNDGTMVVVEKASHRIGKNTSIVVATILQTSAGQMIFARLDNDTK